LASNAGSANEQDSISTEKEARGFAKASERNDERSRDDPRFTFVGLADVDDENALGNELGRLQRVDRTNHMSTIAEHSSVTMGI
jgi:hypothetical protein